MAFDSVPTIHDIYYDARELANKDNTRVYLNTSYDQVKNARTAAMYDADRKQWYITGQRCTTPTCPTGMFRASTTSQSSGPEGIFRKVLGEA
jgi:hypothetical protein